MKVMKLLIMQFFSASYYVVSLGSRYSHQYLVIKIPQSMFSFSLRHQLSHLYKFVSKITILYIILYFYTEDAKTRDSQLNATKHRPNPSCF
jgi:hypothetical protein